MKNCKIFVLGAVLLIAVSILGVIYFGVGEKKPVTYVPREVKINGVYLTNPKTIQDFQLIDHKGRQFSKNNLMGHWTMMFFGFTNCGYVCPTAMEKLNQMYKKLKMELPNDQLPQVVFVTVDPERDSINRLNEYMSAYNESFLGVRAELPVTEALERQLHVSAFKVEAKDDKNHYVINHSAEVLLFNPKGQLQAYLSFPSKADHLVKDYKIILSANIS